MMVMAAVDVLATADIQRDSISDAYTDQGKRSHQRAFHIDEQFSADHQAHQTCDQSRHGQKLPVILVEEHPELLSKIDPHLRQPAAVPHIHFKSSRQADWSVACYQFLLEFSHSITWQTEKDISVQKEIPEDSYASRVIQYLESHLSEPVSVTDLADRLGLNSDYLCTAFKKETGLTIIQYLQRLRIGRARMMLERFPERDAAEIGRACGYESPSYFGLQFKRITGSTPNQYRKTAAVIKQS